VLTLLSAAPGCSKNLNRDRAAELLHKDVSFSKFGGSRAPTSAPGVAGPPAQSNRRAAWMGNLRQPAAGAPGFTGCYPYFTMPARRVDDEGVL